MTTIHYLGPEGTFSELAARAMADDAGFSSCEFVPHRTLAQAMTAVCDTVDTSGDANAFAVVPYYNLIEGLIQETLDLLVEHNLIVSAAMQLPVRFAVGGFVREDEMPISPEQPIPPGQIVWPVTENVPVFSHPKGLAQCSNFLRENLPSAVLRESTSTSQAAARVAEDRFGLAIARRETLERYGLPVLADDIGNRLYSRRNYTEFLRVGRAGATLPAPADVPAFLQTRTMIAVIPAVDRVGLLADILGQIAFFGINLLKIHSRPAPADDDGPAPQMFYLETDTPLDSPELRLCFETLEMRLSRRGDAGRSDKHNVVRVLGAYALRPAD